MNLLEVLTQSIPNAGPKAKASFNDAEQKLQMLEAGGSNRAGVIRQQLASSISSGSDPSKLFQALDKMYYSSLSRSESGSAASQEKPKINEDNAAFEIERALNIGDERGLVLPASDVKFAAEAIAKGDTKKAADYATRLSSRIESLIKQQDEESKTLVKTPEGEQFSIGDKTGTMYRAGIPVSRGQENTGMFNAFALNAPTKKPATGIPMVGETEQLMQAPRVESIGTIKPEPEIYAKPTKPKDETGIPKTTQYIVSARDLYKQGNIQGALDILNGTSLISLFPGGIKESDLPDILGVQLEQPEQPAQTPATNKRPPLESILGR
jgi:hypothetical protein